MPRVCLLSTVLLIETPKTAIAYLGHTVLVVIQLRIKRLRKRSSPTFMEKWCDVSFRVYSSGLSYFTEDSISHQSFPSAPFEAARFKDREEGLLRHSKLQSKVSYTLYVLTLGTFR